MRAGCSLRSSQRTFCVFVIFLFPVLLSSCTTGAPRSMRAPQSDLEHNARKQKEFLAFDPHYEESKAERIARARVLGKQVHEREAAGQNTSCSHQILWEIKALVTQTANFKEVDRRLNDLESNLAHPEREDGAEEQAPEDGSWGKCFAKWYCKLDASCEEIGKEANKKQVPKFE